MWRTDSLEKSLMLGKIEGGRRSGWQRMRWVDGITDSMTWVRANSGSWWWTGRPGVLQSMGSHRVGHDWATELTDAVFIYWRVNTIKMSVLPKLSSRFSEIQSKPQQILCVCVYWQDDPQIYIEIQIVINSQDYLRKEWQRASTWSASMKALVAIIKTLWWWWDCR